MTKNPTSLTVRILRKIQIDEKTGCWTWLGNIRFGYPRISGLWKEKLLVHRIMYDFFYEDLPKDSIVHHICKNKICVNPSHLEAMTQSDHVKLTTRFKIMKAN